MFHHLATLEGRDFSQMQLFIKNHQISIMHFVGAGNEGEET